MGIPLVIGAGVWAYRSIQAYRAYKAVQATARVAQPIARTATAVINANEAITKAQEKAKAERKVTTDYCSSCEDPDCRDLGEKIKNKVSELQRRYKEMIEDSNDLYINHYEISNPLIIDGIRIGSWEGHVDFYEGVQKHLATLLRDYDDLGCPEINGDEPEEWATKPPPDKPNK